MLALRQRQRRRRVFVKGVTFNGREVFLRKELGDARWEALLDEAADQFPFLLAPVLPSTLIPAE
jgi:hypothetical protein